MADLELEKVLQDIITYTDSMLGNARSEHWDEVISIQQQRDALIAVFFKDTGTMPEAVIAEKINYILCADQEVISLGEQCRSALHADLKRLTQGRNAVKAYSGKL